jgi:23S rRNA pseudouridine1911/1915/1917 synthase
MPFSAQDILFEDNHIIAVNKPGGVLVQPADSIRTTPNQKETPTDEPLEISVKQYIKDKYNKPGEVFLGVCHRIDRPVSGVVLLARTSKALVRMNEMLRAAK